MRKKRRLTVPAGRTLYLDGIAKTRLLTATEEVDPEEVVELNTRAAEEAEDGEAEDHLLLQRSVQQPEAVVPSSRSCAKPRRR